MIWHQLPTSTERIEKSINHNYKCFISVGSVSYAIWYWTETSWGLPVSYRALLSVFFGLLVLVAEVVVYMGYINKIEDARDKERKRRK